VLRANFNAGNLVCAVPVRFAGANSIFFNAGGAETQVLNVYAVREDAESSVHGAAAIAPHVTADSIKPLCRYKRCVKRQHRMFIN
jgi:hypothetical protein